MGLSILIMACNPLNSSENKTKIESKYFKVSTLVNPFKLKIYTDPYTQFYNFLGENISNEIKKFQLDNLVLVKYDFSNHKSEINFTGLSESILQKFPNYNVEQARLQITNGLNNVIQGESGMISSIINEYMKYHGEAILSDNSQVISENDSEVVFQKKLSINDKLYFENYAFENKSFKLKTYTFLTCENVLLSEVKLNWIIEKNKYYLSSEKCYIKKGTPFKDSYGLYQFSPKDRSFMFSYTYDFISPRQIPLKNIVATTEINTLNFEIK